jgi:hypothetical protein
VTLSATDEESFTHPDGHHHRTLVTSVLDTATVEAVTMPTPAYWPFFLALGMLGLATATITGSWIIAGAAAAVTLYSFYRWHRD